MAIRHALLALLTKGESTTYALRAEFEASTGNTMPMNIGQVHQTLNRLERDGLVKHDQTWAITAAGRDELAAWWRTPVQRVIPARDELVIKLAMAARIAPSQIAEIVQLQRNATMSTLHDYTRLKYDSASRDAQDDPIVWQLIIDNHIFATEAELRWLDHVEGRLSQPLKAVPAHKDTSTNSGSATDFVIFGASNSTTAS